MRWVEVQESGISQFPIVHRFIPPWRPRPGFPKHSRLSAGGVEPVEVPACRQQGFEVAIPEKSLFVVEPERLEVDQRDVEDSEACHEPSNPNIIWNLSAGWSSSNRRRDAALSSEVEGMASGSNAVVDVRSDDGRGFSGAEVESWSSNTGKRSKSVGVRSWAEAQATFV